MNYLKRFLVAFFVTYGALSLSANIIGNSFNEFFYEAEHYIRTGQSIESTYVELYIVASEEDLIIK